MHVTAIIPAKGISRRLPQKNMQPFAGSTLVGHKVRQLKQCAMIDDVVVGSDDDAILSEASANGASVRRRDAYHCDESQCSANDMIRNLAAMVETDVVVWAHCTNPLCLPDIYDRAIELYRRVASVGDGDSLCSVTRVQRHAWELAEGELITNGRPVNFNPWGDRHPVASELEAMFFQNGAIFIQPRRQMMENGYFYGDRPALFEIEQPYGWDVDTERDLMIARDLWKAMAEKVAA